MTKSALNESEQRKDLRRVSQVFLSVILVAMVFTAFGAGIVHRLGPALAALLWAVAFLAIGACVGFLFGIPKTHQGNKPNSGKGDDISGGGSRTRIAPIVRS